MSVSPFYDFSVEQWDYGYFNAKGSLHTDNAQDDGEQQVLGTTDVTCVKASNTCTVATTDIFDANVNLDVSSYYIDQWDANQIRFSDSTSICMDNFYVVNRAAKTFNIIARKKAIIPDYAIKSRLHPCDKLKDRSISLVSGHVAYDEKTQTFERNNALYFHLYLVALNAAYSALVVWSERRRRRRRAACSSV